MKIGTLLARRRSTRLLKDATERELEERISAAETFAGYCVWAIVFGLVIDVTIAIWPLLPSYDRWASAGASALIALGVYFELHFSNFGSKAHAELRRRTEEQLAEAWTMADKAETRAWRADEMAREAMGIPHWRDYR